MSKTIIVATRPSKLAVTQTKQTVDLLKKHHPEYEFEIKTFSTQGDKVQDKSLLQFGGTGVFVKELEQALLDKKADIAIHSLKDVPTMIANGLELGAFPEREASNDVLLRIKPTLESHEKIVIGTGSPRRIVQLKQHFPNAVFKEVRGNIDTRIQKLQEGQYDAILLAAAGLNRLSISFPQEYILPLHMCLPAVGQGALTIQCRSDDEPIKLLLKTINHKPTELCVLAERSFMAEIEGGCKFPLAAHATWFNNKIVLNAIVSDFKMQTIISHSITTEPLNAHQSGINLALFLKQKCRQENINLNA